MATRWVILGRYLRVGLVPGDVEAEEAQADEKAAALEAEAEALEEQVAAAMDAEEEEAQAEDVDGQADHAAADFILSVALPPRVAVITAGRGAHPDPGSADVCPYVLAASPQFVLVHFSGPIFFGRHFTHHLVLARDLHHGEMMSPAIRVPERANGVPTLWNLETVAFHSKTNGDYTIAELQVHRSSRIATLVYLRSGANGWRVNHMPYPLPSEDREWTPHGAVCVDGAFWWFDLSWGILSYGASLGEDGLIFHHLPARRTLAATATTPSIHTKRCVAASQNKLQYMEIITDGEAPMVCMWSRSRGSAGPNGWQWDARYAVSFEEIWDDDSYKETGLPRNVPVLSVVCPSDPALVYFALEQRLFGVDVPARRVVHYALAEMPEPPRPPSGRYVVAWELQPLDSPAIDPRAGMNVVAPSSPRPNDPQYQERLGQPHSVETHGDPQRPTAAKVSKLICPNLQVDSDDVKIVEVWRDTSHAAFSTMRSILMGGGNYFVAFDTEFCIPDGINVLPYEPPTPDAHYSQLRSYVHGGDLVQIGIGFADMEFNLIGGSVFQFNLFFDPTKRSSDHCGVKFLRESGLRLEKHATRGLPALEFVNLLCQFGLLRNNKVTWVTFMGYPDFGFMINLLTRKQLPEDRTQFLLQVTEYFPLSCDCKFFSKYGNCIKMERVPGKLEAVATVLGVKRTGKGHQAASDALLALRCLQHLKGLDPDFYRKICGVLYGVSERQYLRL